MILNELNDDFFDDDELDDVQSESEDATVTDVRDIIKPEIYDVMVCIHFSHDYEWSTEVLNKRVDYLIRGIEYVLENSMCFEDNSRVLVVSSREDYTYHNFIRLEREIFSNATVCVFGVKRNNSCTSAFQVINAFKKITDICHRVEMRAFDMLMWFADKSSDFGNLNSYSSVNKHFYKLSSMFNGLDKRDLMNNWNIGSYHTLLELSYIFASGLKPVIEYQKYLKKDTTEIMNEMQNFIQGELWFDSRSRSAFPEDKKFLKGASVNVKNLINKDFQIYQKPVTNSSNHYSYCDAFDKDTDNYQAICEYMNTAGSIKPYSIVMKMTPDNSMGLFINLGPVLPVGYRCPLYIHFYIVHDASFDRDMDWWADIFNSLFDVDKNEFAELWKRRKIF